jgi:hypothetical protein
MQQRHAMPCSQIGASHLATRKAIGWDRSSMQKSECNWVAIFKASVRIGGHLLLSELHQVLVVP